MKRTLQSLIVGSAALAVLAGCEVMDPGAGYNAAGYLVANQGPAMASNRAGVLGWGLLGGLLAGQGEYERNSAVANNAVDRAAQQQAEMQRREAIQRRREALERMPRGVFKKITIDHNVEQNLQKGMIVHMNADFHNLMNANIRPIAYFFNQDGSKLMDKDGQCGSPDGQVAFGGTVFNPPYEHTNFSKLKMFIPYSQFDITENGRHQIKFYIQLYNKDTGKFVAKSEFQNMEYKVGVQE